MGDGLLYRRRRDGRGDGGREEIERRLKKRKVNRRVEKEKDD